MQIVRDKNTGAVPYIFHDSEHVEIADSGLTAPNMRAYDIKPDTFEIVRDVPKPILWAGGALSWNGGWVVRSEEIYAEAIQKMADEIKKTVDHVRLRKFYSNVTATFPCGDKIIQFRNELDRANIANYGQAATVLIIRRSPDAMVEWRTEDDEIVSLTAAQMVEIAMGILEKKHAIQRAAWAHKDAIQALANDGDAEGVVAYNVNVGWPE